MDDYNIELRSHVSNGEIHELTCYVNFDDCAITCSSYLSKKNVKARVQACKEKVYMASFNQAFQYWNHNWWKE